MTMEPPRYSPWFFRSKAGGSDASTSCARAREIQGGRLMGLDLELSEVMVVVAPKKKIHSSQWDGSIYNQVWAV